MKTLITLLFAFLWATLGGAMPASASPRPQAKSARLSAPALPGVALPDRRFAPHIAPVPRQSRGAPTSSLDTGSGDTPALCGTTLGWDGNAARSIDAAFPALRSFAPRPGSAPSSPRAPPLPFA